MAAAGSGKNVAQQDPDPVGSEPSGVVDGTDQLSGPGSRP